jgi:hypothetical protein
LIISRKKTISYSKKMKKIHFIILLMPITLLAQAPIIEWQNRFGGSNFQICYDSFQTNSGEFVFGGRSNSNISGDKTENSRGTHDYWMVKVDSNGNFLSDKTIGGLYFDLLADFTKTSDNGFVASGISASPISGDKTVDAINMSDDIWIVKVASNGGIVWQKVIGGTNTDQIRRSVIETSDIGFLIGAISDSDISGDKTENSKGGVDYWIVKLDSIGNVVWDKTIGGSGSELISTIIQTPDGGYLVGGSSDSNISGDKSDDCRGLSDYWIVKINNIGAIEWQKTIGGNMYDSLYNVIQTNDGGYLLGGTSSSPISGEKTAVNKGLDDYWMIKIGATGSIEWQKTYGGNDDDTLYSFIKCLDGNYILCGSSLSGISGDKTASSNGSYDAWIIKIDPFGNIIWQKTIGGNGSDGLNNVIETSANNFFLSGGTDSIISGDIIQNPKGILDYWIVKLSPENLSTTSFITANVKLFPNPTTKTVFINFPQEYKKLAVTVVTVLGQIVQEQNFTNLSKINLEINGAKGIYFVNVVNENKEKIVFKVVKE